MSTRLRSLSGVWSSLPLPFTNRAINYCYYCFLGVYLFVSRINQKLLDWFHKIRCKNGTWATEESSGNPNRVTLGLGFFSMRIKGVLPHVIIKKLKRMFSNLSSVCTHPLVLRCYG